MFPVHPCTVSMTHERRHFHKLSCIHHSALSPDCHWPQLRITQPMTSFYNRAFFNRALRRPVRSLPYLSGAAAGCSKIAWPPPSSPSSAQQPPFGGQIGSGGSNSRCRCGLGRSEMPPFIFSPLLLLFLHTFPISGPLQRCH